MPYYQLKSDFRMIYDIEYNFAPAIPQYRIIYPDADLSSKYDIYVYIYDSVNDIWLCELNEGFKFIWSKLADSDPSQFTIEKLDSNRFILYYMTGYGDKLRKTNYLCKSHGQLYSSLNKSEVMIFHIEKPN